MAQDLRLGIKIGADTSDAKNNVARFEAEFDRFLTNLGKTKPEIAAFRELESAAAAGQRGLKGVDQETLRLLSSFREMRAVAQARDLLQIVPHEEINARIKSVEAAFETLRRSGTLSARELGQAHLVTRDRIRELEQQTGSWSQSLGRAKAEIAVAAAGLYGLGRAVASAAKESAAFGTAMAEVSTLLDDQSQMEELSRNARELATEFGSMPVEQAKALYQIISAGASDSAEATEILTAANKLAVGGVTDLKTAADGLTSILNAYGADAGTATEVSDALFTAMKAGKTTVGELSASIGQIAPIAAQAGAGLEEILAATAALTKGGVSTSAAITQLRGIVSSILKPTAEAGKLAEELGIQFDAAALKTKGLSGFLAEVRRATGGSAEKMAVLFGQVEALGGALALTGKASGDFGQILDAMGRRAGETEKAFAKMADTPEMAAKRFQAAMADLRISVGDAVTSLTPLLSGLTAVVNTFTALPQPVQASAAGLAALAFAAATVGPAIARLWPLVQALTIQLTGSTAAAGALSTALKGVLGPVGLMIAAFEGGRRAGLAFGDVLDYVARAGKADRDALYEARDAAYQRLGALAAQIERLGEYRDTVRLTAAQVAELGDAERAQYAERLGHLEELQQAELRRARLEEGLGQDTRARQAELRAAMALTRQALADLEQGHREAAAAIETVFTPAAQVMLEQLEQMHNKAGRARELGDAFKELGVDLEEVETGISKAAAAGIGKVEALTAALRESGAESTATKEAIVRAFSEAAKAIKTPQELAAFNARLAEARDLGGAVAAAADEVARGLKDKVAPAAEAAAKGLDTLAGASEAAYRAQVAHAKQINDATGAYRELGDEGAGAWEKLQEAGTKGAEAVEGGARAAAKGIGLVHAEALAAREAVAALGEEAEAAYLAVLRAGGRQMVTLSELKSAAAGITYEYARQAQAVDMLADRLRGAEGATRANVAAAEDALENYQLLGDERLDGLRGALADARRRALELRDAAADTLSRLQDEFDQLNRNTAAIEKRRYAAQVADLEEQRRAAQAAKDSQATADLNQALRLAKQIHDQKMGAIAAEAAAEKQRAADDAKTRRDARAEELRQKEGLSAPRASELAREDASRTRTGEFAPQVTRVVRIEGAGGASALVPEDQVEALLRILEQQGMRAA